MHQKNIHLIILAAIVLVLGAGVTWYQLPKKYSANGASFSVSRNVTVQEIPSTAKNYANYQINNSFSTISISLPLQATTPPSSLAEIVKPHTPASSIQAEALRGRTGEAVSYRTAVRTDDSSTPTEATVFIKSFPSNIPSSAIILRYQRVDGNGSLDAVWKQILASLKW